jgi:hypothetical protein
MKPAVIAGVLMALSGAPGLGNQFWSDWDGSDWPDALGYTRSWGNLQGPHQGGANRTLENGILTYDSLYDPGVWDSYYMENFGPMDPGPNEIFISEWRLKVDVVNGDGDPGIGLKSDDGWMLGLMYTEDHIRSVFEGFLEIPFAPHVWHDYQVVSSDMRDYDLFIDGALAHQGTFEQIVPGSYVGWGEGSQSASSLHHWDYFRFGVVSPEPSAFQLVILMLLIVWRGARRG